MNHFLKLLDCSTEEIIELLDMADQLKYEQKHGISRLCVLFLVFVI